MNATVLNDKNWMETTNIDQLRSIEALSQGPRHNPINHGEMLTRFAERAEDAGIKVASESGLLSPDGKRFMYVADVAHQQATADYNFTVGFINFNDRSRAFTGIAGQRVMVCSNLCVTGLLNDSATRHSTFIEGRLDGKIDTIFDKYKELCDSQTTAVDRMKATTLNDELLGKFLLNLARADFMGAANRDRIIKEIDNPTLNNKDDNSLWRLHNAATWVLQQNVRNPLQVAESSKIVNDEVMKLTI